MERSTPASRPTWKSDWNSIAPARARNIPVDADRWSWSTGRTAAIIPPLNIPNMVTLSVIALLLEHFLTKGNPRCYICIPVFGACVFGVLPLMAGFACQHTFWKFGLVGAVVFTATTFLFTSAQDRLLTGPKAKAAIVITAIGHLSIA